METNRIFVFAYLKLGQLRVIKDGNNNVWFCLKDVCDLLGLENTSRVKQRLNERGVTSSKVATYNQYGGKAMMDMTFINEGNLYRCIFQSRKEEAERFQNWVTDEVLPQIRKTGGYIPVGEQDDEKTILMKAMMIYKNTMEEQQKKLEAQAPLVKFAQQVGSSEDTCTMAEMAKLLYRNGVEIGQNRLFEHLREWGYLGKSKHHWNVALQRWVEKGLFTLKVSEPWVDEAKEIHYNVTTLVTAKGQQYILNLFLNDKHPYFE